MLTYEIHINTSIIQYFTIIHYYKRSNRLIAKQYVGTMLFIIRHKSINVDFLEIKYTIVIISFSKI